MQKQQWLQLLPFAIIAFVMWRRWKSMAVAKPLKLQRMWIVPTLYTVLVCAMLWAIPPSLAGWELFLAAVIGGGGIGWQRARMMHLHIDEGTGALMIRQSPAGLIVIVGIILARRMFVPSQANGGPAAAGAHPALPLATDALLGFALGMIVGYAIELWRRAKDLRAA
ncbi:MAG: DUF1453 domain-containing protein [Novosphingobium sp.]